MSARLPIRLRLSLLYAALFFVAGGLLLTAAYLIVERNLTVYSQRVASSLSRPRLPWSPPVERRRADDALLRFLERQSRIESRARVAARDRVAIEFLAALLALTLPSLGIGYLLAGRALRPVARITDAARRVGEGDLSERVGLAGPRDELRRLSETFDAMLERLEDSFRRQREFVANASHELRTPLAIVRAELDATLTDPSSDAKELRAMGHAIAQASQRSEQLVERLLLLAQSGTVGARTEVDLPALVAEALDDQGDEARRRQLVLALGPASVLGDRVLLRALVGNLVENAMRHGTDDGMVAIATEADADGALLRVQNDGAPIPPDRVWALFEPFRRLDGRRSGSGAGLGLAIVKAVADAHAGTIAAWVRPQGGLGIEVRLPAPREVVAPKAAVQGGGWRNKTTEGRLEAGPPTI